MKVLIKLILKIAGMLPLTGPRIWLLRKTGVKIGKNCRLFTADWGSEPYLIEIGNHVVVSNNVRFLTHDGAVWVLRQEYPGLDIFGSITVGNNVCIGFNVVLLPNTIIGDNCIIAAGSVVKGRIPSDSVVFGNPAKVIMPLYMQKRLMLMNKFRFNSKGMSYTQKKKMLLQYFGNNQKK